MLLLILMNMLYWRDTGHESVQNRFCCSCALVPVLAETKEVSWRFTRRKTKQKGKEALCYDEA